MTGETNLATLLQTMQPQLQEGEYVFCTVAAGAATIAAVAIAAVTIAIDPGTAADPQLQPVGWLREAEGLTLILPRSQADAAALPYEAVFSLITLTVHSSLEAVGFLAAITQRLAEQGISVNPVSAYYHDHLFVPVHRAAQAMAILRAMGAA
ncbi:MAG: ACT domain-containing protein [Elainella sp.]